MNLNNHEKSSKYIRFFNSVRVIALTFLITLSSSQIHNCYASLNNIEYNTSQTATNTANINTKLGNIYTALSTLYSYLSNNGNGVREVLGYIYNYEVSSNSYLYNMWTTMNNATYGTLAQGLKLNDIDTSVLAVGGQVADVSSKLLTSNGYLSTMSTHLSTLDGISSDISKLVSDHKEFSVYKVFDLNIDSRNFWCNNASISFDSNTRIITLSNFTSDTIQFGFRLPLSNNVFYTISYQAYPNFYCSTSPQMALNDTLSFNISQNLWSPVSASAKNGSNSSSVYVGASFNVTGYTSSSTIKIKDFDIIYDPYLEYLNLLYNKDFTANIDGSDLEININDSINVTPIELDVQIGIDDFTAVNTVSNKLRSWLSTGVGVVDLIAALDELDDTFFTLHNRSVIETISTGYTDYYD